MQFPRVLKQTDERGVMDSSSLQERAVCLCISMRVVLVLL